MSTLALVILAGVAGAVVLYFFLRANPKKKALIDTEVGKLTKK